MEASISFIRNTTDRLSKAFKNLAMAFNPASSSDPEPWTTHSANLALGTTLVQASSNPDILRPALPPELVLQILAHPTRHIITQSITVPAGTTRPIFISSTRGSSTILRSAPLTEEDLRTLQRIEFEFESKDQGWSGYRNDHGTYRNTWTWFEAVIKREGRIEEDSTADEDERDNSGGGKQMEIVQVFELQRNRHAGRLPEMYRVELGRDHDLMRNLRVGDVVELVAFARFPGWMCEVHDAKMSFWSLDDLSEGRELNIVEEEPRVQEGPRLGPTRRVL